MSNDRKYIARAIGWAFTEAKTGTPQVYVEFQTKEGEQYSGYLPLGPTEKAFNRTMEGLSHCGYMGTDLVGDCEKRVTDAGMDRNDVEIVVEDNEWEGKVTERVKWINKLGGNFTTLDPAKKAAFSQEFKAKVLAFRQVQPKQAASGNNSSDPPAGHPAAADIPF